MTTTRLQDRRKLLFEAKALAMISEECLIQAGLQGPCMAAFVPFLRHIHSLTGVDTSFCLDRTIPFTFNFGHTYLMCSSQIAADEYEKRLCKHDSRWSIRSCASTRG